MPKTTHGLRKRNLKRSKEYIAWGHMIQRCRNKNHPLYKNWGGRGIKVCERWLSFENFFSDMGVRPEKHSLDRIDNNGNYEPGNCRWATSGQQQNNRSDNKRITFLGETKTVSEWAEALGIKKHTLYSRLSKATSELPASGDQNIEKGIRIPTRALKYACNYFGAQSLPEFDDNPERKEEEKWLFNELSKAYQKGAEDQLDSGSSNVGRNELHYWKTRALSAEELLGKKEFDSVLPAPASNVREEELKKEIVSFCTDVGQLLQSVKEEWQQENCWSDWDEKQLTTAVELIQKYSPKKL